MFTTTSYKALALQIKKAELVRSLLEATNALTKEEIELVVNQQIEFKNNVVTLAEVDVEVVVHTITEKQVVWIHTQDEDNFNGNDIHESKWALHIYIPAETPYELDPVISEILQKFDLN